MVETSRSQVHLNKTSATSIGRTSHQMWSSS